MKKTNKKLAKKKIQSQLEKKYYRLLHLGAKLMECMPLTTESDFQLYDEYKIVRDQYEDLRSSGYPFLPYK